ncbi:MAG: bifunctional cobalt-precorrin-7 (C(5))-methyltransferase/cobalt-precorrin-6B (C(15))-methyltransferase [Methyloligellaceae bacterium]
MNPWLTIVGIGDDGIEGLTPAARRLVEGAEVILASERVLGRVSLDGVETHCWSSPMTGSLEQLRGWRGRNVVILATGDPMHYGVSALLSRHFPREEIRVVPAPSAFALAAARMLWPLQEVETLSLHGRPVALIQPFIQPGARLLVLTSGAGTVREVASILCARGYGESKLAVLEHMGGEEERIVTFAARDCGSRDFADFNTLAVECAGADSAPVLPRVPGLPDDVFVNDGLLTRREIRAATLAALAPVPGALLWDAGAGSGSVAIEWMRAARGARAIAFEQHPRRLEAIAENALALGTPGLDVVAGEMPDTLAGQERPAAIFLGGAVSSEPVFAACWEALLPGGRLVANAVTLEGESALIARQAQLGGDLVRIAVAHLAPVGRLRALRPRMDVLQWRVAKV